MGKIWSKDAEREQLRKIQALIMETEPGSYIRTAFAGVPEICEQNITSDFGNSPVKDLEQLREKYLSDMRRKDAECGQKLLKVEHERDAIEHNYNQQLEITENMKKTVYDQSATIAELHKLVGEWENNAHDAGELYQELEKECALKDLEIRNLKAEIVRMKLERMTDIEYAELYDRMNEED